MALFLLFLALCRATLALQVTPGSLCAARCLDSLEGNDFRASDSNTKPEDVNCRDASYVTTDSGVKFRQCVDCLQTSTKFADGESDLKWYIYNLRYALGVCLFSLPGAPPNKTADSPCDVAKACRPLKEALTSDGLEPSPQTSRDYCTADKGAFKRSNLAPCAKCLRATEGQAYLSNFLTALEAGCAQNPADGHLLGLSSSLFTADAVDVVEQPAGTQDDNKAKPGLTGSAIAGIVVGVVLIFLFAAALFIVYWRRQETVDAEDSDDEDHKGPLFPDYPHQPRRNADMARVFQKADAERAVGGMPSQFTSAGEYYDHVRANRPVFAADFIADAPGASNSIPTHFAHIPGTTSRTLDRASPGRGPSPFATVDRPPKSNKPDTFAIGAYLAAAEDATRLAPPPAAVAPKPRELTGRGFRALASLPKLGIPKMPRLRPGAGETATPGGQHRGVELQISEPVMAGVAEPGEPAKEKSEKKQKKSKHGDNGYIEVPLRSGESALYGI